MVGNRKPKLMPPSGRPLPHYRQVEAVGGWPYGPARRRSQTGYERSTRVPALRARLAGDRRTWRRSAPPGGDELYDDELVAAVQAFQVRGMVLRSTGSSATVRSSSLNVPVQERIQAIVVAMERWRWMPTELGDDHLLVNIAGFDLRFVRDGAHRRPHGRGRRQAVSQDPGFQPRGRNGRVESILECAVQHRGQGGTAQAQVESRAPAPRSATRWFRVTGSVPVTAVNWRRYGPGNFPFRLRQRPGPRNALGRVKLPVPQPVQRLPA